LGEGVGGRRGGLQSGRLAVPPFCLPARHAPSAAVAPAARRFAPCGGHPTTGQRGVVGWAAPIEHSLEAPPLCAVRLKRSGASSHHFGAGRGGHRAALRGRARSTRGAPKAGWLARLAATPAPTITNLPHIFTYIQTYTHMHLAHALRSL
jgi:hypothetical protein